MMIPMSVSPRSVLSSQPEMVTNVPGEFRFLAMPEEPVPSSTGVKKYLV